MHVAMYQLSAHWRHVLRFYGQFQESVVETNLENYRQGASDMAAPGILDSMTVVLGKPCKVSPVRY